MSAHFFARLAVAARWACLVGALVLSFAPPAGADDLREAQTLLARLSTQGYEVLPLSRGYGLRPQRETDYRLVEAIDGQVFLDGKNLEGAALVSRVGPEVARDLEALARIATEARALELEQEIESKQEQLEQLRERPPAQEPATKPEPRRDDDDRPRRRSKGEDVMLGGSRTVSRGETSAGLVLIGGSLRVEEGGTLQGDATVIGGVAEIYGEVAGSLVVIGGSNTLGPKAAIGQDMVTIGARLDRDQHAEIGGEVVQFAATDWQWLGDVWRPRGGWGSGEFQIFDGSPFSLFFGVARSIILVVLIWLCLALAPQRVAGIAARSRAEPWRSVLVGMLVQVLLFPVLAVVSVILIITLIGIPFLAVIPPLILLAFVVYNVVGFAGIATVAGSLFTSRLRNRFALAAAGALLIQSCSLIGVTMDLFTGPLGLFAGLVLALGFLVKYAAWTTGLGATVLERYSRPLDPPVPAEPPVPDEGALALTSSADLESR